jgi:hypothetical protein
MNTSAPLSALVTGVGEDARSEGRGDYLAMMLVESSNQLSVFHRQRKS